MPSLKFSKKLSYSSKTKKFCKVSVGLTIALSVITLGSVSLKVTFNYPSPLKKLFPSTLSAFASENIRGGNEEKMRGTQISTDSRSDCPDGDGKSLIRLSPVEISDTIQTTPTLWFYIPYATEDIEVAIFTLQDADGYNLLTSEFPLPSSTPGLVGFEVPYELTVQNSYQWYFSLYCDEDNPPLYVHGLTQVIEPSAQLSNALAVSAPREDSVYRDNDLWVDAIEHIISLYSEGSDSSSNTSLLEAWDQFLAADAIQLDKSFEDLPLENLSINKIVLENTTE